MIKIVRYFTFFVLCVMGFMLPSFVSAYDIVYKADYNIDTGKVILRNFTQASSTSISKYQAQGNTGWIYHDPETAASDAYYFYGIRFQENVTTKYEDGFSQKDNSYVHVYKETGTYDVTTTDASLPYVTPHPMKILNSTQSDVSAGKAKDIDFGSQVQIERWRVKDNAIRVDDYAIGVDTIQEIASLYNWSDKIRFSWKSKTTSQVTHSEYKDDMSTAWKFYYTTVGDYWLPNTKGYVANSDGSGDAFFSASTNHTYVPYSTAVNNYDNILQLPEGIFNRKVYVKHVVDGQEMANNAEVLINKDKVKSRINNQGSKDGYPEYYEIGSQENLQVSRLYNIFDGQYEYEYQGGYMAVGNDFLDASHKLINTTRTFGADKTVVQTDDTKKSDVTIIVMNYKKKPIDEPDPKVKMYYGTPSSESCDITYVPAGDSTKPYITTSSFYLKNLQYTVTPEGDYVVDDFKMYQLDSGTLTNYIDRNGNVTENGRIIGSGKDTVFDGSNEDHVGKILNLSISYKNNELKNAIRQATQKYKNITSLPTKTDIANLTGSTTDKEQFETEYQVPQDKYNGLRRAGGKANYVEYDVLSDRVNTQVTSSIATQNEKYIVVYSPIELSAPTIKSESVNHSTDKNKDNIIQKNGEFTLSIDAKKSTFAPYAATVTDTSKYIDYYYVLFDFNVQLLSSTSILNKNGVEEAKAIGTVIEKGTPIKFSCTGKTSTFKAKASSAEEGMDIISQTSNKVIVIGVSKNMPDSELKSIVLNHESQIGIFGVTTEKREYINTSTTVTHNKIDFTSEICNGNVSKTQTHKNRNKDYSKLFEDAYYFARAQTTTNSIGRIYDFKVTDCSDVNFKNVFRTNQDGQINGITGVEYYSGNKELKMYSNTVNMLVNRNVDVANTSIKKMIPLGPYKHIQGNYMQAPKMGYRISFDLKTSGYYDYTSSKSKRKIEITPSYYYISKDGSTFVDNVNLYYKDASSKYKLFNGSGYSIEFKPKDGYRSIANSVIAGKTDMLSDKFEKLTIGSKSFELNSSMMTTSDNDFIQAWYGEFKLPNSTIAVDPNTKAEHGNVNNPFTNGYIGVRFNMKCIDSNGITIGYNEPDSSKPEAEQINTTEWDYEGFLAADTVGKSMDGKEVRIQLDNGIFHINSQSLYEKVKGTVVLFDLDNRAADDFQ